MGVIATVGVALVLTVVLTISFTQQAEALPSFARQTGQPCGTCHTDFPALTPFGRRFKLLGYTVGGGKFRTTPFPTADDAKAAADKLRNYCESLGFRQGRSGQAVGAAGLDDGHRRLYPHAGAAGPADRSLRPQRQLGAFDPFSGFWGGAITDHIGAFAQVTYDAPGAGRFRGSVRAHLDLG